jgi:hypothetical protein
MNESEWLESCDPTSMLVFLRDTGTASERKLRLFVCACCRRIWPLIPDKWSRKAVERSEGHADGLTGWFKLHWAANGAWDVANDHRKPSTLPPFSALIAAQNGNVGGGAVARAEQVASQGVSIERQAEPYCSLLRELFGNPFRPVTINPIWLTPAVTSLAQAAYQHRSEPSGQLDPDRLAVLSDALEEAGCDDDDILSHLRGPGPHVRGCWAVDLTLGKE